MELTDRDLVARAQQGDLKAFRVLVERHQERVHAVALAMLRLREDAMDATQEIFIKVYKRLGDFRGEATFLSWLYRVATHHCVDRRRRDLSREGVFIDAPEMVEKHLDERDPETLMERADARLALDEALQTLSDDHRMVLILREIEGLSYEEIAAVMQCPKGTVMSRLHHARKEMQMALAPFLKEVGQQRRLEQAGTGVRRRP